MTPEATPRDAHRRLLGLSRAARALVAGTVVCGALAAVAVIVQAWVVADVVAGAVGGRGPTTGALVVLGAAVLVRALSAGGTELLGRRAAEHAAHALRRRIADRALAGRGGAEDEARRGDVVTAATQGVDALGDYYARAVPAIALAGAVPVVVVGAVAWRQPIVGGLLAITLPVLVVFMVLVGRASAEHARERQRALAILGAHFLEVVRALPTLRAHGRERAQARTLDAVAERYRAESLDALRVAFLSALVLELFAMLGIAIAAATTGVLLATGNAGLGAGLFVLLLAPEVYAPLRAAGQRFHAAEDGAHAARRAFAFLDEPTGPGAADGRGADRDEVRTRSRGDGPTGRSAAADAVRTRDVPTSAVARAAASPASDPLVLRGVAVDGTAGRAARLRPLDLVVPTGRSVALVGPSGSGKTTLLAVLAGLREPDRGSVLHGGLDLRDLAREAWWRELTWLPQRPALPAGTLRDALRTGAGAAWGDAPADLDARIDRALALAGADGVVAGLPDGLGTPVGPGGRILSAGQTQRLALAGALASATPLVLLDEPTAHLDARGAEHAAAGILEACAGRTLLVATHDPVLIAACDAVIDLGRTPTPAAAHTAAGFARSASPWSASATGIAQPPAAAPAPTDTAAGASEPSADGRTPDGPATDDGASRNPATAGRATRISGAADPAPLPEATRRAVLRPVALGLLSALAGLAVLAVSGWLVVRAAERPPVLALLTTIVLVRGLGMIRALARYWERLSSHELALADLARERRRWYGLLAARVGAPGAPGAADLLTRFTTDVDELQHRRPRVELPTAVAVATAVPAVATAVVLLPGAGLVLLAGLAIAVLAVPAAVGALARTVLTRQGAARARFAGDLDVVLRDGAQLAVAGLARPRAAALDAGSQALGRVDRRIGWAAALGQAATVAVGGAVLLGVLVLGGRATATGDLDPVWLGALVLLVVAAFEVATPLPEAAMRRLSVARARARLDAAVAGPATLPEPSAPRPLPARGTLRAEALTHRPGGPGTPVVLDGVSLAVTPGEHVAVVGPSGAGKSTLAGLLARLADPDEGRVSLGAEDLRGAATGDVRGRIRLAGQDAHLVATSLGANVRIGAPDATDDEVVAALRTAGLGPWLRALPDGLHTLLGEDGAQVSGGQRQRIGLARTLVSPAAVVVLDEPTAMLDAVTAADVTRDVLAAAAGRSVVWITHATDDLARFDRVLELRAGRLTELPRTSAAERHAGVALRR